MLIVAYVENLAVTRVVRLSSAPHVSNRVVREKLHQTPALQVNSVPAQVNRGDGMSLAGMITISVWKTLQSGVYLKVNFTSELSIYI